MPDDAVLLGPGEGRRFWTGLSQGAVKVESGSADFSVFEKQAAARGSGCASARAP